MNQPISAEEYSRRMQWYCADHFKDAELLAESYWDGGRGARWVIGKPNTFVYRAEIIAGIGGSLLVHGDIDDVRFASYGDRADAWSRLTWMGLCRDLDYYVEQKACIGTSRRERCYEPDVAVYDINRLLEEREMDQRIVDALIEARDEHADDVHALRGCLDQVRYIDDFWEWGGDIGEVIETRIVNAHAALHRCVHLLVERYGWEGPLVAPPAPTHFCPFIERDEKGDPIPLRPPRALPPDSPVARMSVEQRRKCVEARLLVDGILYARDVA